MVMLTIINKGSCEYNELVTLPDTIKDANPVRKRIRLRRPVSYVEKELWDLAMKRKPFQDLVSRGIISVQKASKEPTKADVEIHETVRESNTVLGEVAQEAGKNVLGDKALEGSPLPAIEVS